MVVRAVMVTILMSGCGGGDAKPDAATVFEDAAQCIPGAQAMSTLYLNFNGGTYDRTTMGDDAITNRTGTVDMTRTLAAWPLGNAAGIKTCVEMALEPFKIAVTDVDPGNVLHHEVVLSDTFWTGDTAVRTIGSQSCGNFSSTLVFVFATPIGDSALQACEAVLAQFANSAAALDHATDCRDYLSEFMDCGPKSWLTTPTACGDESPRNCVCGGSHQISMKKMTDKFGASCAP